MCSRPRLQSHIFDENIYFTSDIMQIGPNVCITYREKVHIGTDSAYTYFITRIYHQSILPIFTESYSTYLPQTTCTYLSVKKNQNL